MQHTRTYTQTHSHTHTAVYQGNGTEEMGFGKGKVFKQDLKDILDIVSNIFVFVIFLGTMKRRLRTTKWWVDQCCTWCWRYEEACLSLAFQYCPPPPFFFSCLRSVSCLPYASVVSVMLVASRLLKFTGIRSVVNCSFVGKASWENFSLA